MTKPCAVCEKGFYVKPSHSTRRKTCSLECRIVLQRGRNLSVEHKRKIGEGVIKSGVSKHITEFWKGKKRPPITDEHRKNLSTAHKGQVAWNRGLKGFLPVKNHDWMPKGENHYNWKGGITCEPYCVQWNDKEYKDWIKYERDQGVCQNILCSGNSLKIVLHHINYIKKDCRPINLITLCNSCNGKANKDRDWHTAFYNEIMRRKANER